MQHSLGLTLTVIVVSFVLQAVLASLSLKITIILDAIKSDFYTIAVATSVLDLLLLSIVFALALSLLSYRRPQWLFICYACSSFLSSAGFIVTIYFLARLSSQQEILGLQTPSFNGPLFPAAFTVWTLSFIAHIVLYVLLFQRAQSDVLSSHGELEKRSTRTTSSHSAKQASVQLLPMQSAYLQASASTAPDATAQHGILRSSVASVLRPVTSRTRLIKPLSIMTSDDRSQYSGHESPRKFDAFQDWNTTRVPQVQMARANSPQLSKTRLETIPGSRPVSPATALDGPFQEQLSPTSQDGLISRSDLSLPATVKRHASASSLRDPRSRSRSLQQIRRPSTAQCNVHPLFRSESPHPAPIPSPNTVILASPLAGQVVNADSTLGARRANSRPGSLHSYRMRSPSPSSLAPSLPQLPQE